MNIKDQYIHGADGKGVVKSLYFATGVESVLKLDGSASYNTAAAKDLVFQLADINGTKIGLPIPTLNQNTTGYASKILTQSRATNASHYLVFVDSNNSSAAAESLYTDAGISYNPSTDTLALTRVTVSAAAGFNYTGIETGTSDAARHVWFANASQSGTPVKNDNFKFNPAFNSNAGKLFVNNIEGTNIKITIGNTAVPLGGTYTPDTSISSSSTNNTIPSSLAVYNAILNGIATNDAMIFKGVINGGSTASATAYTPAADKGHTYKVATAGYINGEYYQVNDTFICTADSTAAATSSNVSTIKTKWAVVEGNGDYLNIHGGKMFGTLQWNDANALPQDTTPQYFLTISAFGDGGTTKWTSKANLLNAIKTGLYWANQTLATASSTTTEPQFGKVGIGGAKDSTAKLKVYGNEIVTGNLTIGGCTLVYESSCLKFTF